MRLLTTLMPMIGCVGTLALLARSSAAQQPAKVLLALEKRGTLLDIIDAATLKVIAKAPAGADPHEVIASTNGKVAYISNYGGPQSTLHTISVVDLVTHAALPPIDIAPLHGAHGLDLADGKLYFTAEPNKAIGRYDPVTRTVDWVLGTGQDRTHMVWVGPHFDRIVTSNVSSATISIIELGTSSDGFGPPGGTPQKSWEVTSVPVGKGSEGFDVAPDGTHIWAANARDATVSIIDIATKTVIQTIPISVKGANRLKFTLDGTRVLISGLGAGGPGAAASSPSSAPPDLIVLDAATRKEVKALKLGGGSAGILMDPNGSRAFVAVSAGNKIAVIDLQSLSVSAEIAPLGEPDGMAWAMGK